jgi:hypothetical protein
MASPDRPQNTGDPPMGGRTVHCPEFRTVDPTQVSLRQSIARRRQFPAVTIDGERQGIDINNPGDRF